VRARGIAVLAWLLLSAGCGYLGPVEPPSRQLPNAIVNLSAIERGDQIVVTFSTPTRTTDNLVIKRFSEIDLRIGPAITPWDFGRWSASAQQYLLPPPPSNDPDTPKPIQMSRSIPVSGWEGKRVAIAVRTAIKKEEHYSSWSNVARLNVIAPLAPPMLKAESTAEGIELTWPQQGEGTHYRVFRQAPADKAPVEIGIADGSEYVDKTSQYETPYKYTAVAMHGAAESLLSEPVVITSIDIFPPKVPANITVIAAANSVEVSWERSPDPDLKGYYVYRSVNGGPFERQGDLVTVPAFSDHNVEHGKSYRYEISAVDQKNNESAKSAAMGVAY